MVSVDVFGALKPEVRQSASGSTTWLRVRVKDGDGDYTDKVVFFAELSELVEFGESIAAQARALMPQPNPYDLWGPAEASK